MLLIIEKNLSTGGDVRGVGQYTGWTDWMLNQEFLVDSPGRRDKAFKPGLFLLKREVCYAYLNIFQDKLDTAHEEVIFQ